MTPYYSHGGITIYHGDCREIAPSLSYDAIVCDAPYGIGEDYRCFDDTPENVGHLARDVGPLLLGAKRAAVFSGVPQMWLWPKPKWVLCWSYHPATNAFSPWGYAQWQPLLCYGADPYLEARMGPRPTVWTHFPPPQTFAPNGHPCPKPITVMHWAIGRTTASTDVVLDLFMGSGTTLRAAKDMQRNAIGIDIDERYCEIAAKRLEQEVLDFGGAA